jgi:mono/diheme cytochrome c family protein
MQEVGIIFCTKINNRRSWSMKRFMIVLAALAMMLSTVAFAQEGADLFKAKCAGCHGAGGEGKMGPSLKGKSEADVTDVLTNGGKKGPHTKAFNATPDQVKSIAGFVATLK